jgi:hypothetical protein
MSNVTEELLRYRRMLRLACKQWGKAMPDELVLWWDDEQITIAAERASKEEARLVAIADLQVKIATMQARLDALVADA